MPNQVVIPVDAGNLPLGFCPSTLQEQLNGFASVMSVTLALSSGATGIVVSSSKPAATNVLWLQLDPLGRPIRLYWFGQGSWISLHPTVPGLISIWVGTLPDFTTFDGGDANGLSATSGPMWEVVPDLQGKFPLGAGTLPSGAVVNTGDIAGNDKQPAILDHSHTTGRQRSDTDDKTYLIEPSSASPTGLTGAIVDRSAPSGAKLEAGLDTLTGVFTGTSNVNNLPSPNTVTVMPPYLGINFIRRTQRLYYSVT